VGQRKRDESEVGEKRMWLVVQVKARHAGRAPKYQSGSQAAAVRGKYIARRGDDKRECRSAGYKDGRRWKNGEKASKGTYNIETFRAASPTGLCSAIANVRWDRE